ncbi:hypothetical protein [Pseudonocardia abyssalis]|uniref:DUF1700 domain-containing protein n=1 Tax=Pseudonocardia abyssalis TaxID=2792008 RepID=A0ABS6UWP7_9PSEU|nr:hypothetical protein [Pseudonocardia abyssalis]MBW0114695.1 hypothetical protein [Pseudonocardia abyssalis]MBW0136690.1 hypothetical protein [Pseudonocardia abyssalis]
MSALTAYLREFDACAHQLSQVSRLEVGSRIWTHCAEHAGPDAPEERIAAALAELGPPADLVRAELERTGERPDPFRTRDLAPMHLLGTSLLTIGVGTVAGLVLLWLSRVWPVAHKAVATALVVAGVPAVLPFLGGAAGLVVGLLVVGPALAGAYLALARRFLTGTVRNRS